ncbi:hypothetical protein G4228_011855 [Cervus hanglu yarkandensis]|nr:hypothetical protein G4228_011855 [Cervus hanglu yarkandensis]
MVVSGALMVSDCGPPPPWILLLQQSSLSLDKGTQALEDVARLLEVPAGVFTDVEVEGPAVTFRVRANAQNVTAAAAAKAAVLRTDILENSMILTRVNEKEKLGRMALPPVTLAVWSEGLLPEAV